MYKIALAFIAVLFLIFTGCSKAENTNKKNVKSTGKTKKILDQVEESEKNLCSLPYGYKYHLGKADITIKISSPDSTGVCGIYHQENKLNYESLKALLKQTADLNRKKTRGLNLSESILHVQANKDVPWKYIASLMYVCLERDILIYKIEYVAQTEGKKVLLKSWLPLDGGSSDVEVEPEIAEPEDQGKAKTISWTKRAKIGLKNMGNKGTIVSYNNFDVAVFQQAKDKNLNDNARRELARKISHNISKKQFIKNMEIDPSPDCRLEFVLKVLALTLAPRFAGKIIEVAFTADRNIIPVKKDILNGKSVKVSSSIK